MIEKLTLKMGMGYNSQYYGISEIHPYSFGLKAYVFYLNRPLDKEMIQF